MFGNLMGKFRGVLVIMVFSSSVNAQNINQQLKLHVIDSDSIALQDVNIIINNSKSIQTDNRGFAEITLPIGNYSLNISHLGYENKNVNISLTKNRTLTYVLISKEIALQEVVFTAKEDKGLTSKSVIDRKAMEHLQPSSFSDLMELLPGGLAKQPNLTTTNVALIRESSGRPIEGGYNTSSLGVQFMVDDNIINSNSDMQRSLNQLAFSSAPKSRNTISTGIDMRSISTNDIEKVEIIRGIPSAAYGDLTSGLIKIERKIGVTPLQARVKVDGYSKQYYVGKGFSLRDNWKLNTSFDFLDAKMDPSDDQQNYQRITASLRSELKLKLWNNPLKLRSNLDFSGTLDNVSIDPDNAYAPTDRYKSYTRKFTVTNNFIYELPKKSFFDLVTLNTSIRQGFDRIEQRQFIQYSGPRALPLSTEEGESVGIFAATSFVSEYMTDGKPLDLNAQLQTTGKKSFLGFTNTYELGIDWRYSKNNGRGDVYDVTQPPSPSMSIRPRAFRDIPATQNIAAFIGDRINYKLNKHSFTLYGGLRMSKLLGVDNSYKISNKIFVEPRLNFQYGLPQFMIAGKPLQIDLTLGYGLFYKQPTTYYLYPNKQFTDYVQLNYYHDDARYRYINYMTYVQSLENKNITAAKNIKKEVRVDFSYNKHNFSITYYKEDMNNGFRPFNNFRVNSYKKYDATKVDLNNWTANGPDLTNVPYTIVREHAAFTTTENGSVTDKEGIEFQYSTPRFKGVNTRFTLSGAWFKTKYYNDIPVYEKPTISIGGVIGSFPYIGIYENDDAYTRSNLNYNMMMDTYIPSLDLTFSASVQGSIFNHYIREKIIAFPTSYIDLDGQIKPYTEVDKTDIYKQHLERNVARSEPLSEKKSYTINVNFKVTKSIYKALRASMFVNQLYNYTNPYYFNNIKVEMVNKSTPYFGVEMNYNF
ncbi:TonB-dependent receptor [Empedobacter tilapiae]|uniref:TonB-dependent receptor n=1 Tax=Empedobacter tilapiae TaxID=2491114 RepID=A0A4Z1B8V9_9FLAO|nr:carboxypeptidase-like regulatory domain-containing protein [Empedobacter tilapiae]TGN27886.1 TonB-dependent receptor [Empedobacter tilapiae]